MTNIAFIFPGQGSQTLGMSADLAEKYSVVRETYSEASEVLGLNLWELCQQGPIEKLNQTEFTQPALLTAGVAAWRSWLEQGGTKPSLMAGHSLGEYTALCCAGALKFSDAVGLVRDRGHYMQEAVPAGEGGMAAIIGLDDETVTQVCREVAGDRILQAVNFNAPGQIVIAGQQSAIKDSLEAMKSAGAKRALPLPVSIPAHSDLMSSASEKLAQRIDEIEIQLPEIQVVHNCNVQIATNVEQIKQYLVTQLDSPVLWVQCIETMIESGADQFVESGPGKVLSGMVKRISRETRIASIDNAETMLDVVNATSE